MGGFHLNDVSKPDPFYCTKCGKEYVSYSRLKNHWDNCKAGDAGSFDLHGKDRAGYESKFGW